MSESNPIQTQRPNPLVRLAAAHDRSASSVNQLLLGSADWGDAFAEVFASMAASESPRRSIGGKLRDFENAAAETDPPPGYRSRERSDSQSRTSEDSQPQPKASPIGSRADAAGADRVDAEQEEKSASDLERRLTLGDESSVPRTPPSSTDAQLSSKLGKKGGAGTADAADRVAGEQQANQGRSPDRSDETAARTGLGMKGQAAAAAGREPSRVQPTSSGPGADTSAATQPAQTETAVRASSGEMFEQNGRQPHSHPAADAGGTNSDASNSDGREKGSQQTARAENQAVNPQRSQPARGSAVPTLDHASMPSQPPTVPDASAIGRSGARGSSGMGSSSSASAAPTTATVGRTGVSPVRSVSAAGGESPAGSVSEPAPPGKAAESGNQAAGSGKGKGNRSSAADAVSRAKLVQRVSKAFQHLGPDGGSVRLRLAPAELGTVRVEMRIQDKQVQARVIAETDAASAVLREHLPDLRGRLEAQGMQLERIEIQTEETQQERSGSFDGDPRGGDSGGPGDQRRFRRPTPQRQRPSPAEASPEPGASSPGTAAELAAVSSGVDIRF